MQSLSFPDLPGSAEAQVIWHGIVKCLLIAYFIRNISANKYQNPFTRVKVIASQRWDAFVRHSVVLRYKWNHVIRCQFDAQLRTQYVTYLRRQSRHQSCGR